MKYAKIADKNNLIRDMETTAVLNVDRSQIDTFNAQRRKILSEKAEREQTKIRLSQIEDDMREIKNLLKEITKLRSNDGN
jgi:hypothetical protein